MTAPPPIRILLVDDDGFVRSAIKSMLQRLGQFEVTTARDGYDALETLHALEPDLILCDIGMTPMDGLEFVENLRAHADPQMRAMPVVMLTANGKGGTILKAMKFGIVGYLLKPISAKQLRARIEAALKRRLPPAGAEKVA
jgi:CheY-like chemotaxis protein